MNTVLPSQVVSLAKFAVAPLLSGLPFLPFPFWGKIDIVTLLSIRGHANSQLHSAVATPRAIHFGSIAGAGDWCPHSRSIPALGGEIYCNHECR